MAKFGYGEKVGFIDEFGDVQGPYTFTTTDAEGRAWFDTGTWVRESKVFPWKVTVDPAPTPSSLADSWDYAEAQRLKDAAKAAIGAYNAYVAKKPTDVFIQVIQPFQ